jgi:hypothetical protein
MTDTTTIEHETHVDQPVHEQTVETVTATVEPEQPATPLSRRAELVPVGPSGAAPANLQQQIDFAQFMAKARNALPDHLRGNVGDCLAVLDISSRAGLSPYMVANKTYVQNNRLCFESQLFHALLVQSGKLKGDLLVTYQGEGDERTCTVKGTMRSDGIERTHTSQPLKDARPAKNDRGQIKGSPLWSDKPDVQLFYDTSRDWIRMFAPTATLGIYAPEEFVEHPIGPEGAITVSDVDPSLHERLKGTDRTEGHKPGQAIAELANVAAGGTIEIKANKSKPGKAAKAAKEPEQPKQGRRAAKRAKRTSNAATANPEPKVENGRKGTKTPVSDPKSPIQRKAELEQAAAPNGQPKTGVEYWGFARDWIIAADNADNIEARWNSERDMRDELSVSMKARRDLEKLLETRTAELRGQ